MLLVVGPLRCRVMQERGTNSQGEQYWRIWRNSKNIWSGWATEEEVLKKAGHILSEGGYINIHTPKTIDSLIKLWSQEYRDRKDIATGSKDTAKRAMLHITKHLGSIRLDEVNQATIDSYRDKRLEEGAAPSTINLEYRRLVQAWNWGRKRNYYSGQLPQLNVVQYRTYTHYIPTDEEIEKVITIAASWSMKRSRWLSIFLLVAYLIGARLNEVATLTWGSVNLEGKTITFKRKRSSGKNRTKSEYLHTIPVPERLIEALKVWKQYVPSEPTDSVLNVGRGAVHSQTNVKMKRACSRAGVPTFTPHGLRYAAVRRFKRAGVPVGDAAEYFSHSPLIMLGIYDEVETEDLLSAVERVYGTNSPNKREEGTASSPVSESVSNKAVPLPESQGSDVDEASGDEEGFWEEE